MSEALQSYTPTERPIEYDSLTSREGCEIISGNNFLGWLAFTRICVFAHDLANYDFNQPDTVSYSVGPETNAAGVFPFHTLWTAWVATAGVRVGKVGKIIPPADTIGAASSLYPGTLPTKIAHAFNNAGLLAMAIQKNSTQIEIKRYTDGAGTIATHLFIGFSPIMFNTAVLDSSIESKSGILVAYLRPERPTVLFGRFERDTTPFGTERVLMPDLRVAPARLLGASPAGRTQVLRYIDVDGRDVTLTSPVYTVNATIDNKVGLMASLADGRVFDAAVPITIVQTEQKAKITMALDGGFVYFATVSPDDPNNPLPIDSSTLVVGLDGGEVTMP